MQTTVLYCNQLQYNIIVHQPAFTLYYISCSCTRCYNIYYNVISYSSESHYSMVYDMNFNANMHTHIHSYIAFQFSICQYDMLHYLREFVKTRVILAPLREFSRSRAASKIPFPGAQPGKVGQPGWPGEFQFCHFRYKNRYLRSRVI